MKVANFFFGIRDLAYLKARGIRDFLGKLERDSGLLLRTGHRNWQYYEAGIVKCQFKESSSLKLSDENV